MNYYLCELRNTDMKKEMLKRFFLWLGIFHFVTGIAASVLLGLINWRFAFIPLPWFLWGFVYGDIGHMFVVDYRYEYDGETLVVWRHRRYGKYKQVLSIPMCEVSYCIDADREVYLTNCQPTIHFVYNQILYYLSPDPFLRSLLKGEHYVFGQCGND